MIARRSLWRMLVSLCAVVGGLLCVWSAPALAQRMHVFSKSFGGEGSGEGKLMQPGQLAVNEATGDVYVIDRGNGRVEIFSSTGAYVGQFNGSASPTGAFSWPKITPGEANIQPEGAIAVDNSANLLDPSKGDVYVVDTGHTVIDKFTASGAYIGQVTGRSPTTPFSKNGIKEVAVDPTGALRVSNIYEESVFGGRGSILQFNDALVNEYVSNISLQTPTEIGSEAHQEGPGIVGLAFESEGNFYTGLVPNVNNYKFTVPIEFSKTGEPLIERLDSEETTGLAVDLSSDDVYVDHETSVVVYGPTHSAIERFGSGQMQASEGIAVDSATGTVYTANASSQEIDIFTSFVVPDVTTEVASNFAETSVTVGGVVNPDGLPVTSCVFEYGTSESESYGLSAPCSPSPGSGSSPVAVSAELGGLERLTKYHFRLKVANANGSNVGQEHTFVTPEPVALSEASVSDVSSTSALFSVQVNPGGADTTFHFEYGPSVSYGESVPVPAGDLGPGTSSEPVSVRAEDLLGETTYHVRVVASNVLGTVYGPDETFTTQGAGAAFALPDGREWELVSPPNKNGARIEPTGGNETGAEGLTQASVDGGAVSYYATAPVGAGVKGNPSPFGVTQALSRRGVNGWSSEDITTPNAAKYEDITPEYLFFSPDLSQSIIDPFGFALLSPEATERTPYVHDPGSESYLPLVTASNVTPGTRFAPTLEDTPEVVAVTPDFSHVLITSDFALTSDASESPGNKIYEWSGGQLQLVGEGSFGSNYGHDRRNALSSDGSRVFFGSGSGGQGSEDIYMRDMTTGQVEQVDAPAPGVPPPPAANKATFQIASADGSEVFFLDEEPLTSDSKLRPVGVGENSGANDLYVRDTVTGALTDLSVDQNAGEQAEAQDEVLGAGEEGSIVYFVAKGKLAEGAVSGADNLYVDVETGSSWSALRLVAVLSEEDDNDWGGSTESERNMREFTSRVSASGRYLAFMSDRSLTGYDNRDALSGVPDEEVFLYDEATGGLRCVSCNSTGARPAGVFDQGGEHNRLLVDRKALWGGRWLAASIPGWVEPTDRVAYQSRVLSDEGRVFFDSADALVPKDTNGKEDVYEYESQGAGSCTRSSGCVSLISSGTSAEESAFLDASGRGPGGGEGEDVFFLTAARLVPGDIDTAFDVYDAHICSTAAPCANVPVSPPPCTSGDSCKAAPSPQPAIFGAPSSATFSGAGNVTSSPLAATPTPKSKPAKCKGGVLKRGKCVKKPKRLRKKRRAAKSSRGGKR